MKHSFCGGKYEVESNNGILTAKRNGEPWLSAEDLAGNNLVYWMLVEVDYLKIEIQTICDAKGE